MFAHSYACSIAVVMAALQPPLAETTFKIVQEGLRAIACLACDNTGNQTLLSQLGACAGESIHAVGLAAM